MYSIVVPYDNGALEKIYKTKWAVSLTNDTAHFYEATALA